MIDLDISVESVAVEAYAIAPLLVFKLKVTNTVPTVPVQSLMLNCQIRIEPARRQYGPRQRDRLKDLFGEPERWGQTLQGFLWTHASVATAPFAEECSIDLPAPCSYDFNIAATKYFHGLEEGEAPLLLLFSGSVFYRDPEGQLQVAQLPWSKEAAFRLPVETWRSMMDHYYPNCAWLCLRRDVAEQLYRYKRQGGLPTFEQALEKLLADSSKDALT
ncbi:DUF6084 family protein [Methylocapsa aurea]|uniref:DUF6084 family protein n=1 Tax=Methylocapsa aurea TaxID=663610 RepID=UPI00055BC38A|nr:DUF6084 family protein [Methylocapsa aurea]